MKPRAKNILITASAALAGVGIATALALLLIVPLLKNTCTLFNKRCVSISYQRQPNGQLLVKHPEAGLSYWYDGNVIRSYGPYLPGWCPTPDTVPDTDVGVGPERVLCERVRPDGTCASKSGAPTIPSQLAGQPRARGPLEPAFVMNATSLTASRDGVLCSRARGVVENSFSGKTKSIKVRVPAGANTLDASQMFRALKARGIFAPQANPASPCNGNGVVDPLTALCVCTDGFVGSRCGTRLCVRDDECGHGTCNGGLCRCEPGFDGDSCTQRSCPVCLNGSCDPRTGECVCMPGFIGDTCAARTCLQTCIHGACNPLSGVCECESGWKGVGCENKTCPGNCSGNGICNSPGGTCECNAGWRGESCDEPICEQDCSFNGKCNLETETCECEPGWTGSACDVLVCSRGCCSHGACTDATCVCAPGWGGADCSVPDDPLSTAIACPGF